MPARSNMLVIDIGGTNTRIGLASDAGVRTDTIRRFRNAEHSGLDAVLAAYLSDSPQEAVTGACAGVAGPVRNGVAHLTNIDWVIDRQMLADTTGAPVTAVINDMQAQGHSLDELAPDALDLVMDGPVGDSGAARLVINLGTGFNSIPVYQLDGRVLTPPGETGHMTLPGRADHAELMRYLTARHGYPSVESALSGQGLENIFRFLGGDPALSAAQIMMAFADGSDATAQEAMRLLTQLLGTLAGDLALAHLPFGGLYLTGGVARHVAPHLMDLGFRQYFTEKGPFTPLMSEFRVSLITDDYAALRGCAHHLRQLTELS